jgi:hypothetical protein
MISDRVWEQLKAALEEAKHSRAGAENTPNFDLIAAETPPS